MGERAGAELAAVGQQHDLARPRQDALLREGLAGIGRRQPGVEREAEGAHEGAVDEESVEQRRRERSHERLAQRPQLAADDDEARPSAGQLDDGGQAVRDDGDVAGAPTSSRASSRQVLPLSR